MTASIPVGSNHFASAWLTGLCIVSLLLVGACHLAGTSDPVPEIPFTPTSPVDVRETLVHIPRGGTAPLHVRLSDQRYPGQIQVLPPNGSGLTATPAVATIPRYDSLTVMLSAKANLTGGSEIPIRILGGPTNFPVEWTITAAIAEPYSVRANLTVLGRAGAIVSDVLVLDRFSGFTAPISLSMSGLPPNSSVTFGAEAPGTELRKEISFSITTPEAPAAADYTVIVHATGGGIAKSATFYLQLEPTIPTPELSMQLLPGSVTMSQTDTARVDIVLARTGVPLPGAIDLSATNLPSGVSASFAPANVTGTTSRLTLISHNADVTDFRTVRVTGSAGAATQSRALPVAIVAQPNIAITSQPGVSLTGVITQPLSIPISVTRTGAVGDVTLDALDVPDGVTAVFSPSPLTGSNSTLASTLSFTTNGSTSTGFYTIRIRATAGSIVRTIPLVLTVVAPPANDFSLAFAAASVTVAQGESVVLPVSIARTGTQIGAPVQFAVTSLPPQSNGWTTFTTTPGNSTQASLVIGGSTPPGPYQYTLSGTNSASLVRSATITVNVTASAAPDYALVPVQRLYFAQIRSAAQFIMNIQRTNGFSDAVAFSVRSPPPGLAIQFSPTPTGGNSTTIDVYATDLATPGTYVLTIDGRAGSSLVRTALVTLIVLPP